MLTQILDRFCLRYKSRMMEAEYKNFYLSDNIQILRKFSICSWFFSLIIMILSAFILISTLKELSIKNLQILKQSDFRALINENYQSQMNEISQFQYFDNQFELITSQVFQMKNFYGRYYPVNDKFNLFLVCFLNFANFTTLVKMDFSLFNTLPGSTTSTRNETNLDNNINNYDYNNNDDLFRFYQADLNITLFLSIINHQFEVDSRVYNMDTDTQEEKNKFLISLTNNLTQFIKSNQEINSEYAENYNIVRRNLFGKGAFTCAVCSFVINILLVILIFKISSYNKIIIFFFLFYTFYGINFHILAGILRSYINFSSDTLFILIGLKMIISQVLIMKIRFSWFLFLCLIICKHIFEMLFFYANHINFNSTLLYYLFANMIYDFSSVFICRYIEIFLKCNYFYFRNLKNEKKYLDNLIENIGHGFIAFSLNENKIFKQNKFITSLFEDLRREIILIKKTSTLLNKNNQSKQFNSQINLNININDSDNNGEIYFLNNKSTNILKINKSLKNQELLNRMASNNNDLSKINTKKKNNNEHKDNEIKESEANDKTQKNNSTSQNLLNAGEVDQQESLNGEERYSDIVLLEILLLNLTDINDAFPNIIREKISEFLKHKKLSFFDFNYLEHFNDKSLALSVSSLKYLIKVINMLPELFSNENFIYIGKVVLNNTLEDLIIKTKLSPRRQKLSHKKEYELYLRLITHNKDTAINDSMNQYSVELILNDISIIIKRENKRIIEQCKNIYLSKSAHELKNPITSCKECLLEIKDNLEDLIEQENKEIKDLEKRVLENGQELRKTKTLKTFNGDLANNNNNFYSAHVPYMSNVNQKNSTSSFYKIENEEAKRMKISDFSTERIFKILEYLSLQLDIMNEFLDGIEIFSSNSDKHNLNNKTNQYINNTNTNNIYSNNLNNNYDNLNNNNYDLENGDEMLNHRITTLKIKNQNFKNSKITQNKFARNKTYVLNTTLAPHETQILNPLAKSNKNLHINFVPHSNEFNVDLENTKLKSTGTPMNKNNKFKNSLRPILVLGQEKEERCEILGIVCEQIRNFNNLLAFENKPNVKFSENILILSQDKNFYVYANYKLIKSMIFYIFYHCYKNVTNGLISISIQRQEKKLPSPKHAKYNYTENLLLNIITPKVLFDQNIINLLYESLQHNSNEYLEKNPTKKNLIKKLQDININDDTSKNHSFNSGGYPEIGIDQFSSEDFNNYFFIYIILIIAKKLKVKIQIENNLKSTIFGLVFKIDKTNPNDSFYLKVDKTTSPEFSMQFGNDEMNNKNKTSPEESTGQNAKSQKHYSSKFLQKEEFLNDEKKNSIKNNKRLNVTFLSVYQKNYISIFQKKEKKSFSQSYKNQEKSPISNNYNINIQQSSQMCDTPNAPAVENNYKSFHQSSIKKKNNNLDLPTQAFNPTLGWDTIISKQNSMQNKNLMNFQKFHSIQNNTKGENRIKKFSTGKSLVKKKPFLTLKSYQGEDDVYSNNNSNSIINQDIKSLAMEIDGKNANLRKRKCSINFNHVIYTTNNRCSQYKQQSKSFLSNSIISDNMNYETRRIMPLELKFNYIQNNNTQNNDKISELSKNSLNNSQIKDFNQNYIQVSSSVESNTIKKDYLLTSRTKTSNENNRSNINFKAIGLNPEINKIRKVVQTKHIPSQHAHNREKEQEKEKLEYMINQNLRSDNISKKSMKSDPIEIKKETLINIIGSEAETSTVRSEVVIKPERKVLIVEDEEVIKNSLKRFFNKINEENFKQNKNIKYQVYEASNGLEAISIIYNLFLNNILIDFAITDEMMPYLKGSGLVSFMKGLAEEHNFYDILFISYTSYNNLEVKQRLIECGVDDIINKPIDYPRFKNYIYMLEEKFSSPVINEIENIYENDVYNNNNNEINNNNFINHINKDQYIYV